jgi:hypothetical protein
MFTEGVISDDTGKVILNLMQQDAVAMRMVMRLAYATVNPVTIMKPGVGITARWPFGAVLGVGTTPPTTGPIDIVGTYPGGTMTAGANREAAAIEEASVVGSPWEQGAREAMEDALDRDGDGNGDESDEGDEGRSRPARSTRGRGTARSSAERTARSAEHTARSAEHTVRSTDEEE